MFSKNVMAKSLGYFNLNWFDRMRRRDVKDMADTFQLTLGVENPTRPTTSLKTFLDFISTNKVDRISKTYNLITGISDRNLTLVNIYQGCSIEMKIKWKRRNVCNLFQRK